MHLRECAEATTWALTQALREAELTPSSIRAQSELNPSSRREMHLSESIALARRRREPSHSAGKVVRAVAKLVAAIMKASKHELSFRIARLGLTLHPRRRALAQSSLIL
jgi:hypothetical protein